MARCQRNRGASLSRALFPGQGAALVLALILFAANWSIARADDYDYEDGGSGAKKDDYDETADEDTGSYESRPPSRRSPPSRSSGSSGAGSSPSAAVSDDGGTDVWKYVVIAGIVVVVVAVAIVAWICCRRSCRAQPHHDIETGMAKPQPQGAFITSTGSGPQAPSQIAPPQPSGDSVWWAVAMKRYGSMAYGKGETWYVTATRKDVQRVGDIEEWVGCMLGAYHWTGLLVYNDQPCGHGNCPSRGPHDPPRPDPSGSSFGHCKGVVLWNDTHVGWLVHSLPRWPDPRAINLAAGGRGFPRISKEQRKKGQSFAWIIMPRSHLDYVLRQVRFMQAYVDCCVPEQAWPYGVRAPYGRVDTDSHVSLIPLSRQHGIYHVAKHPGFEDDIYHEYLAKNPDLGGHQKWFVQTWTNTSDEYLPPEQCRLVTDIQRVGFPDGTHCSRVSDHSKWAFATQTRHVFIGDLNRSTSQYKRGGGGIVIHSQHLYDFMSVRAVGVRTPLAAPEQ